MGGVVVTDAILDVLFTGLTWLVELIPEGTIDLSDLAALAGTMGWLGSVFDMAAIVGVMTFALTVEVAFVTLNVALWLWRLTPLSG